MRYEEGRPGRSPRLSQAFAAVISVFCLCSVAGAQDETRTGTTEAPAGEQPSGDSRDYSLDAVLQGLRADRERSAQRLTERENRYQARLDESRARLAKAQDKLAATEAEGRRLEARFDDNKTELADKDQLLKEKIGALKELFGVFQQNASDLIGAFNGSPTSIQYPDRDVWLEGFANRMKNASEVSSADDIKTLWYEVLREIAALGEVVRLTAPVTDLDGGVSQREIVRVGAFNVITADPEPAYLQWAAGQQRVETMPRQPTGPYAGEIEAFVEAESGLHTFSVDPTGGVLLSLLSEKPTPPERIDQGGLVGYMILGLGAFALVLALLKMIDITAISLRVSLQQRDMENPQPGNALGRLLRVYRENRRIDPEILEMRLHDCVARESGRIQRFTIFLAIIAAVAPLMGLLGTVVGMINTFQAITLYGTGDPQTMAGGISQALITTVLGLTVAVPAVLLHAAVSARAKAVINVLKQQMALLLGDRLQAGPTDETRDVPPMSGPTAPQPA